VGLNKISRGLVGARHGWEYWGSGSTEKGKVTLSRALVAYTHPHEDTNMRVDWLDDYDEALRKGLGACLLEASITIPSTCGSSVHFDGRYGASKV
jgi:hypothetical protein